MQAGVRAVRLLGLSCLLLGFAHGQSSPQDPPKHRVLFWFGANVTVKRVLQCNITLRGS